MTVHDLHTDDGILLQFQRVVVMLEYATGNARPSLDAFCVRMYNIRTFEALARAEKLPVDTEYALLEFVTYTMAQDRRGEKFEALKHNAITNIARLLNMEIKTPYLERAPGRIFVWIDRGKRMAAKDNIPKESKPKGDVNEHTGRASRRVESDPQGPLDNPVATLHVYQWTEDGEDKVPLQQFYWKIKFKGREDGGFGPSFEGAVDLAYQAFYKHHTAEKFKAAMTPKPSRQIILLGSWMTNEEYKSHPHKSKLTVIPDVATDKRTEGQLYVLGSGGPLTKKMVLIKDASQRPKTAQGSANPEDWLITLESGVTLDGSLEWYVYKPEQLVKGEVSCVKCGNAGIIPHLGARFVRGNIGMVCGPCLDHFTWHGEIAEDLFDSESVTF